MGLILRQSVKGSLATYLGVGIGYLNVVYLYPRFFGEAEIGIIRFLVEAATIFGSFALLGSNHSMVRYYPKLAQNSGDRGFAFLAFLVPATGFLLVCAILYLFREPVLAWFRPNAGDLLPYAGWIAPLAFLFMMGVLLDTYASIRNRITVPKLLKEGYLRIVMSVAAVAFGLNWLDFDQTVLLVVALNALQVVASALYLRWLGPVDLRPDFGRFDAALRRDYLVYTGFLMLGGLSQFLLQRLDFIMVSSMQGMAATGVYSTAFYMAMVIEIPKRSIQQIAAPVVADGLHRGDTALVSNLYRQASINQLLVGMLIFLGVWVNLHSVFDLMPNGEAFRAGVWVFFFIGIGKLVDLGTGIGGVILNNSDFYKWSALVGVIAAAVGIAGNLWLIPLFGLSGAALATAISFGLLSSYTIAIIRWKTGLHPFTGKTVVLLALFAAAMAAHQVFGFRTGALSDVLWNTALFFVPFAGLCHLMGVSPELNRLLRFRSRP